MRKMYRYILYSLFCFVTLCFCGCGQKDELVLVTTEKKAEETSEQDEKTEDEADAAPVAENETVTEEASEEEQKLTLEDLQSANSGDALLAGGQSCSVNTVYYANGTEIYSEYRFLGFEENGSYIQVYENSEGDVEVLDNYNQCWYVYEDNALYTKICPENGVSARLVDYTHNHTVISFYDDETLCTVYREDGKLVFETEYTDNTEELYTCKYYVDDNLLVDEIYCYDASGEKLFYTWVTRGAVYNTPDEILAILNGEVQTRMIQVHYPEGDGYDNVFLAPTQYPVVLELYQYTVYTDEGCTQLWSKDISGADGLYGDVSIYLRNNQ